jgi:hypothetical protein
MFYIDNFVDMMARHRHDMMRLKRNLKTAQRKYDICRRSMGRIETLEAYKKYSVENRALFYALRAIKKNKEAYDNCKERIVTLEKLKDIMANFDYSDTVNSDIEFEALLEVKVFLTYNESEPCLYLNFIDEDETLALNKCPITVRYNPNLSSEKFWQVRFKKLVNNGLTTTTVWSDTYFLKRDDFIEKIKLHVNCYNIPLE